jgi:hypothetical protein
MRTGRPRIYKSYFRPSFSSESEIWDKFIATCNLEKMSASKVLTDYMRYYVRRRKLNANKQAQN